LSAHDQRRGECLANRLFPMLLVARIPSFPPALITTTSISAPLLTTTKFATTGSVDADGVSEPAHAVVSSQSDANLRPHRT
jgi:hypothetical protein